MGLLAPIREWWTERRASAALRINTLRFQAATLRESADLFDTYVDPREPFWDDGKQWQSMGGIASGFYANPNGVPFTSQVEHDEIRAFCRNLVSENEYAAGLVETMISYIVGTGHVYTIQPKDADDKLSDEEKATVQEIVDEFIKANKWHARQQEIQRRLDRDGECFLRFFETIETVMDDAGEAKAQAAVKVRFVEPSQVRTPTGEMRPEASFGILTEADDVETVLSYFVDEQPVDAKEIQHRKRNVDCNIKRGLPRLYQSRRTLPSAAKVTRNGAVVTAIQAAVSMVRKHGSATQDKVQSFVSGKADVRQTVTKPTGGTKQRQFQQFEPGTIIDIPGTSEYEFPAIGVDPSKMSGVVQMVLRGVGSRSCIPEYMISGDASNANYASTLVAEGPAVKLFQREQWTMIEEDEEVFDRVLAAAVKSGRLSQELVDRVKVKAEPPTVIARDELKGTQKNQILANQGVLSTQTWAMMEGLDYEDEQENIEQHVERTGGSMVRAQVPGDIPQEEDEEGDQKPKPGEKVK